MIRLRTAIPVLLLFCSTTGCIRFACKEVVLSEIPSPDGVLVATSVSRDCGATTDFSTSVNLHRRDHGFDEEAGDLFVAAGRHRLSVTWLDADRLKIQCNDCTRKQISRLVTVLGKTDVVYDIPELSQPSQREGG